MPKFNYIKNPRFGEFEQWAENELDAIERAIGSIPAVLSVEEVSGTTYTLVLGDQDKTKKFTSGSAVAVTVPLHSNAKFEIGAFVYFLQYGAGQVTLAGDATSPGVTIRSRPGLVSGGQYSMFFIYKIADNEWVSGGDLVT